MFKYLSIMYQIATMLLLVGGENEHLKKKRQLWKTLREMDQKLYRRMRYHPVGVTVNLPGKSARRLLVMGYHGLGKYIGFN